MGKKIKIAICGGHFSPALAIIEELKKRGNYSFYYFGAKKPLEKDEALSLEYLTISKLKIPFFSPLTARWQRNFSFANFLGLGKVILGIFQSLFLLKKIKPDLILSFGSYLALPVCLAGWLLRIPLVIHEQTFIFGLTNRILSLFADFVCLSYPNTLFVPPKIKTIVTGNPLRRSFFSPKKSKKVNFGNPSFPLIFITGGSLGARTLNQVVEEILPSLTKNFRVLHQCGRAENKKDLKNLQEKRKSLPRSLRQNYQVVSHIFPEEMGAVFHATSLIIGRAGANTVAEIGVSQKPAILIPLPWSAEDEQNVNAQKLREMGLATVIPQERLTGRLLLETIASVLEKRKENVKREETELKNIFVREGTERLIAVIERAKKKAKKTFWERLCQVN